MNGKIASIDAMEILELARQSDIKGFCGAARRGSCKRFGALRCVDRRARGSRTAGRRSETFWRQRRSARRSKCHRHYRAKAYRLRRDTSARDRWISNRPRRDQRQITPRRQCYSGSFDGGRSRGGQLSWELALQLLGRHRGAALAGPDDERDQWRRAC